MPRKVNPYFAWVTLSVNRRQGRSVCGGKTWDCGSNIGVKR
jgi:hypothetical protein